MSHIPGQRRELWLGRNGESPDAQRLAFASWKDRKQIAPALRAIYSLHMQLRKILKSRGHFPMDVAASKLLYLVLGSILSK